MLLYVEDALKQLRESFDASSLNYDIINISDDSVRISVVKNNTEIIVWFDKAKQIFGFDMLQGGCKTYDNFNDFEQFFTTYLLVNTEFLPNAKLVADTYEEAVGVRCVYDNIQGNKQSGYVAQFKVLGQDNKVILISKTPECYIAKLGIYTEDGSKFKVVSEYKYEVDEVGNISALPTIYSYMNTLSKLYADDTIQIDRIGVDIFEFTIENLHITAKVEFMYKNIQYHVCKIEDIEFDFDCELEDDPYKLSSLYMICKDKYDDSICEDDISDSEVEESEIDNTDEDGQYGDEVEEQQESSNEVCNSEASVEEPEQVFEPQQSYSEESMDFSVKVIRDINGVVRSLQFVSDGDIFVMSVDKAKSLGIPVERINEEVQSVMKHGIIMTQDEINSHSFAKDISEDDTMCNELFNSIFS